MKIKKFNDDDMLNFLENAFIDFLDDSSNSITEDVELLGPLRGEKYYKIKLVLPFYIKEDMHNQNNMYMTNFSNYFEEVSDFYKRVDFSIELIKDKVKTISYKHNYSTYSDTCGFKKIDNIIIKVFL